MKLYTDRIAMVSLIGILVGPSFAMGQGRERCVC